MTDNQQALTLSKIMCTKQFGPYALQRGCDIPTIAALSTGLPELDSALGIGGIPVGRIVEIYGPPSAGKTALALQIAKQAGTALFIDAERALCRDSLPGCEDIHTATVDTLQDALRLIQMAAPAFDVIILDTLTALPVSEELTVQMGELCSNTPAKVLSAALPRLSSLLSRHNCTLILVNQTRTNAGVIYGNPEKVPGGNALKHYASVRLEVRCMEYTTTARTRTGQIIRMTVVKNKCAPAFRSAAASLDFGKGFLPYERAFTA